MRITRLKNIKKCTIRTACGVVFSVLGRNLTDVRYPENVRQQEMRPRFEILTSNSIFSRLVVHQRRFVRDFNTLIPLSFRLTINVEEDSRDLFAIIVDHVFISIGARQIASIRVRTSQRYYRTSE